ncbi:hypothetical protein GGX14DRAFT_605776 [Mycena pura]|uniref:Uncharacterized protein n=1 Tax=Mycena pura TaxID=153505 RepID=A0AAD6Y1P9_9AGAR|nr:hypothetical protein GGX14DRAFT_605776 [Mycena pura]
MSALRDAGHHKNSKIQITDATAFASAQGSLCHVYGVQLQGLLDITRRALTCLKRRGALSKFLYTATILAMDASRVHDSPALVKVCEGCRMYDNYRVGTTTTGPRWTPFALISVTNAAAFNTVIPARTRRKTTINANTKDSQDAERRAIFRAEARWERSSIVRCTATQAGRRTAANIGKKRWSVRRWSVRAQGYKRDAFGSGQLILTLMAQLPSPTWSCGP